MDELTFVGTVDSITERFTKAGKRFLSVTFRENSKLRLADFQNRVHDAGVTEGSKVAVETDQERKYINKIERKDPAFQATLSEAFTAAARFIQDAVKTQNLPPQSSDSRGQRIDQLACLKIAAIYLNGFTTESGVPFNEATINLMADNIVNLSNRIAKLTEAGA